MQRILAVLIATAALALPAGAAADVVDMSCQFTGSVTAYRGIGLEPTPFAYRQEISFTGCGVGLGSQAGQLRATGAGREDCAGGETRAHGVITWSGGGRSTVEYATRRVGATGTYVGTVLAGPLAGSQFVAQALYTKGEVAECLDPRGLRYAEFSGEIVFGS